MTWFERLNREAAGRIAIGGGLTVEVLHWAYVPHLPDNILHRHTYFEVCLVGEWGSGQFRVGQGAAQTQHRIGPGNLFIARPGVLHQIVNDVANEGGAPVNMELMWLSFHVPVAAAQAKRGASVCEPVAALFTDFSRAADVLVVSPDDALAVAAIWNALRVTASSGETAGRDVQMAALTAALLLAIAQAGGAKAVSLLLPDPATLAKGNDRLARQAVQYIHQHLSRPLPVGEIADALAVSPRHLARLLRAYTGVSPQEYVEQARLDRARTLLLRTDDPIKQVALLAGYADVAHFTRAFGRHFGCPPGAFRRTGGNADKTARGEAMQTPGALV